MKNTVKSVLPIAIALLCSTALATDAHRGGHMHEHQHDHAAHADQVHEHAAHEHGTAQLDIVLEGSQAHIHLQSPAANLLGFEHHPQTEQQQATLRNAMRTLQQELFHFEGGACTMTGAQAETDIHDENRDGHADFEIEYRFDCADTANVGGVETHLFEHFPGISKVRVQFIKGAHQGSANLTPANPRLRF
jgi:hypothetical protein